MRHRRTTLLTTTVLFLGIFATASCVAAHPPPDPRDSDPYSSGYGYDDYGAYSPRLEVGFFYDELSPYGEWIFTASYGWAWFPRHVDPGWRPYYYGRWVPSAYGWLWVSNEPFGWATYHYGRWAWYPRVGWVWVPGTTWGPAWVSWQYGAGYVGWAPLPPQVGFDFRVGLQLGGFSLSVGLEPYAYTFVPQAVFLDSRPYRHAVPSARNVTIIRQTTNITNYTVINQRVVNRGVDFDRIERVTGRQVRPLAVAETPRERSTRVRGSRVEIYRPSRDRLETVRAPEPGPRRGRPSATQRPATGPRGAARDDRRSGPEPRGVRPPTGPTGRQPNELEVAPRATPESRGRSPQRLRDNDRETERRLEAFQRQQRDRLEREQRAERSRAKSRAESDAIDRRHAAERRALEEQMQRQRQQIETKQRMSRQAAEKTPPERGRGKGSGRDDQRGRGQRQSEDQGPPPGRR